MRRVNLLPWREARRQARGKQLQVMLVATLVLGGAGVYLVDRAVERRLSGQEARNAGLQQDSEQLDELIARLSDLAEQRDALLEQLQDVEVLQEGQGFDVLERLVYAVPQGVQLTGLLFEAAQLNVSGLAPSGAAVARFLRNLGTVPGLQRPELQDVQSIGTGVAFQLLVGVQLADSEPAP